MSEQVLLIDDDQRLVNALQMRLSAAGYQVHTAANGYEGLCVAALSRPDVIILDIRMPEMDGYEVCRLIRTVPELRDIPIIILSASIDNYTVQTIIEAGGNVFLRKPYELPHLLSLLRKAIDGRRPHEARYEPGAPLSDLAPSKESR